MGFGRTPRAVCERMSMGVSCWRGAAAAAVPRSAANLLEHLPSAIATSAILEDEIATVADDLRAIHDQLLLQARQQTRAGNKI